MQKAQPVAKKPTAGKYRMPENFYERVLDYERQIDTLKQNCPEHLLKSLTNLYSDAIEYHGYLDNH